MQFAKVLALWNILKNARNDVLLKINRNYIIKPVDFNRISTKFNVRTTLSFSPFLS